jgi:hypothetical protein
VRWAPHSALPCHCGSCPVSLLVFAFLFVEFSFRICEGDGGAAATLGSDFDRSMGPGLVFLHRTMMLVAWWFAAFRSVTDVGGSCCLDGGQCCLQKRCSVSQTLAWVFSPCGGVW